VSSVVTFFAEAVSTVEFGALRACIFVWCTWRKEGRKEGNRNINEGRKEGRKEIGISRKERRKKGRKERRE
jgi:hypothetical protein